MCWMEIWRREGRQKCQCVVWESTNTPPLARCYLVTCAAWEGMICFSQYSVFVSVYWCLLCTSNNSQNEHKHGWSPSRYICIYHTHFHTHTNTSPRGAVVDNSLRSTPDASVGTVVFVLKQQERTSAETFYGPCRTADLGWALLFQILTSATAVEIPTLTPDQHLRLISLH